MTLADLPVVNASLNGLSTVFLVLGYYYIRRDRQRAHRNCMVSALATSTLFLVSYLTYHYYVSNVLQRGPTRFTSPEWLRPIYLGILASHTILAMVILPLVIITVIWAIRGRWEKHRRLARWTWPLWIYVSITGVVIYILLYHVNRPPA